MDNETKKFVDALRHITLSDAERAFSRERVMTSIRATSTTSPFWSWLLYIRHAEIALLALVILGGYGGTVSIVAADALPGDTLYEVKTRVTEPLVGYLTATTPLEQATFETSLLEKRLAEAEKLDGKIDTDPTLKKEVQERVRSQSARAKSRVAVVDSREAVSAAPASLSMAAPEVATSAARSFSVVSSKREDVRGIISELGDERGKSKQSLRHVYERHEKILKRLELENESD